MIGDIASQVSCGRIGGERVVALLERYGLKDLQEFSDAISERCETATRERIRPLPAGTFHGDTVFDISGSEEITIRCAVAIDNEKGEIVTDFTGSSGTSPLGISVCLTTRSPTTPSRCTAA